MHKLLRKIYRIFVVNWGLNLNYRGDIFLWTIVDAITPLVALAVWYTVSLQGQTVLSSRDTITYYILTMLVLTATNSWLGYFLTDQILQGKIVNGLLRPLSIFWDHIADNIITKVIRLTVPLIIFIAVAQIFPTLFSPSLYEGSRIALAVISIICGAIIAFLTDAVLACLSFWIEDVHQIIGYHHLLYSFTSGIIIPFALLPSSIHTVFAFLPYRYIISAPVEILVASAQSTPASSLIGIQLIWIAILSLCLRLLWRKGLKVYAIPGQ